MPTRKSKPVRGIARPRRRPVLKLDVMRYGERFSFLALFSVGIFTTLAFGIWWFQPYNVPHSFYGYEHAIDILLFSLLTYIAWHPILMDLLLWYMTSHIEHPERSVMPQEGLRVAYMTAFVPGAEPLDILEQTLSAMVDVDYPHDTWLLDEGNDSGARAICERLGVKHYSRHGRAEFNTHGGKFAMRTKGGNYNSWLHHYVDEYDVIAQHDVDFVPKKNFLMRTLGYFRDPSVAFIGTPQVYGNTAESWIAAGAAQQTYGFYGPLQKGFFAHDMTLLIGANHIFRTTAYKDIDGYTAHITEDMLTGMKLYAHESKWHSVYVPEVLLVGEGPTTWAAYFKQQMRWAYGCMDIAFRHSPSLLPRMGLRRMINYFLLQQFYFGGVAQTIGIGLIFIYFVFGIQSANMSLLPFFVIYLPLLVYQTLFHLWIQRFNIDPAEERGLHLPGKLLTIAVWPIYMLAFVSVITGKTLSYKVTPKGQGKSKTYTPSLFLPHLALGSITLSGLVYALLFSHHLAGIIVFWAVLNTVFMYTFFFMEALPYAAQRIIEAYSEVTLRLRMR